MAQRMKSDQIIQALRCSEYGGPIREAQERCDYCGFWFITPSIVELVSATPSKHSSNPVNSLGRLFGVLLMILLGIALIGPLANFAITVTGGHP